MDRVDQQVDGFSAARFADALDAGSVTAVFQRIVEMPTGRTVKVEALARWCDPDLGVVTPDCFIPGAEQSGSIARLDHEILGQACEALALWRSGPHPELAVTVNMSPLTLADPDACAAILEVIAAHGLPVTSVWIEATETAMVGDQARRTLEALSRAGVRIALDDFGTGYSTLTHLMDLPVDAVKIDKSIVVNADVDAAATAIVRSLGGLGHELGLAVIAEGVETVEHERLMRRLGVSLLQGYRFGRPQPANRVLRLPRPRPVYTVGPVPAELSPTEDARIQALHDLGILDTSPESAFDTITKIAAEVFATPIALVSLVDSSRQWFKSNVGLDVTETPRDLAFCSHAILQHDVFIVENAVEDPRFAGNPLVNADPNIRFYAGAPLIDSGGHALGTLCVIDRSARRFDEPDRRLLASLAEQVVAHLELRSLTLRLQASLIERAAIELQLENEANHDPLTGLANRRMFFAELDRRLAAGSRSVGVVYLDLNHFKQVNDTIGHSAGDALLRHVADALTRAAHPGDLVARLGGDEFAVLIDCNDDTELHSTEARLLSSFAHPCIVANQRIVAAAAIGGALAEHGDSSETLLHRADQAMYRDKPHHRTETPHRPTTNCRPVHPPASADIRSSE